MCRFPFDIGYSINCFESPRSPEIVCKTFGRVGVTASSPHFLVMTRELAQKKSQTWSHVLRTARGALDAFAWLQLFDAGR